MKATFKQTQKDSAAALRQLKTEIKNLNRDCDCDCDWFALYNAQGKLILDRDTWRHRHIAYCLERGRTYEQIEPKVRVENAPNWYLIEQIRADLKASWEVAHAEEASAATA